MPSYRVAVDVHAARPGVAPPAVLPAAERILAATRMYTSGLRPFAAVAGVTDQIDWSMSADILALYPDPFDDDDQAAAIFGTALVANEMPGSAILDHPGSHMRAEGRAVRLTITDDIGIGGQLDEDEIAPAEAGLIVDHEGFDIGELSVY